MFVLVEYNHFYEKTIKEIKKHELTPVTLFLIRLKNKEQIKTDLKNLKELILKIKPLYSSIQITIDKIDNSIIGIISSLKKDFDIVIGLGGLNKINRFFLEQTNVDFLQDPQNVIFKPKIDFIHHFNSGLNHILCTYAKKKEISFIFTLNFTQGKLKNITKEFGRINQNLKFARKYKNQSLINFIIKSPMQIKSKTELNCIMSLFNISNQQKKESLNLLEKKIKENKLKNSIQYIAKGIKKENT